ncbi:ATP-binding cassette permease mdl1 [Tieghemiomyces parasiticus]|uniref:ATP-binding cassette permease mdl1 n=1 Tax=Tieghemiomyces parasiticus TaxID=78921 RepID=A0A9W7ZYY7_9FUNG|nr:ATP-binding cassette permease mdl1 [Tieghemiomyces parasiticus]
MLGPLLGTCSAFRVHQPSMSLLSTGHPAKARMSLGTALRGVGRLTGNPSSQSRRLHQSPGHRPVPCSWPVSRFRHSPLPAPEFQRSTPLGIGASVSVRSFGFLAYFVRGSKARRVPTTAANQSTSAQPRDPAITPNQVAGQQQQGHSSETLPSHNQTESAPLLRASSPTPPPSEDALEVERNSPPQVTWQSLLRLVRLARPEYKLLGCAVGLLLVSSAITMSVPFAMGKIIDIVATAATPIPFGLTTRQFFAILGSVFVVGGVANAGRVMLIRTAGERVILRLREKLFGALVHQDIPFFDRHRTGDLVSRLANDTNVVGKSLTNNVSDGLRSLVMAGAGLSMMVYMSPTLTGIMLGIVPPISIAAIIYGRFVRDLSHHTQTALGDSTKVVEERLSNIRTVQAFVMEKAEQALYHDRVHTVYKLARREAVYSGLFFGGAGLFGNLAIMAVLGVGGNMVLQQTLTVGELTSFLLYTAYVGGSLSGLTSFYSEIMKGLGASGRIFSLLDAQPTIRSNQGAQRTLPALEGRVTFEDVDFVYPARERARIFERLSFDVAAGSVVGIAGASGSGKSTLIALLLRFYDPQAGRILVDGVDVRDLDLTWWRRQVALVNQEPTLFAGTIAENIAYGLDGFVPESRILEAIRQASCDFIHDLPDGIHTFVGERGVSLSGGQKQRVAIARAIIKNPRILLFDEATSALDSENEYLMKEALEKLTQGRTVITIAHRLSTLKSSDLILCMEDGRVAEMGPFNELMAKPNGPFRKLMEYQTSH